MSTALAGNSGIKWIRRNESRIQRVCGNVLKLRPANSSKSAKGAGRKSFTIKETTGNGSLCIAKMAIATGTGNGCLFMAKRTMATGQAASRLTLARPDRGEPHPSQRDLPVRHAHGTGAAASLPAALTRSIADVAANDTTS